MNISTITTKGQITLPKEIRNFFQLKEQDKVVITIEKNYIILKPVQGNVLDLGGSIQISNQEKPINFKKVRKKTHKILGERVIKEMEK